MIPGALSLDDGRIVGGYQVCEKTALAHPPEQKALLYIINFQVRYFYMNQK